MATFLVESFSLTQEQIDQISTDMTQIQTRTVYDYTPPAGWMIIAEGPLGSVVVCPKPCGKVQLPAPQ